MPAGDFAVLAVLAVRTVRQRCHAVCTPVWAFLQKAEKTRPTEKHARIWANVGALSPLIKTR